MKDSGPWIALLLGVVAVACIVMGPRTIIDTAIAKLNIPTPQATPTLSGPSAAAEATRIAEEQYGIMTAEAAQDALRATTQAGIAQATSQAASAEQVRRAEMATRQAEGTAQVVQATAEHERFVATATSAAEATRAQGTAIAATATRQVEQDSMTATSMCIQITVEARTAKETERARIMERATIEREELLALFTEGLIPFLLFVMVSEFMVGPVLGLLCVLLHIWKEGKECGKKITPS